ncbi:MAG: phage protease [Verrucomicrobiota bacterium]
MNDKSQVSEENQPLKARMAVASNWQGDLKAGSVIEFMVMPAGQHTGNFTQGGALAQRAVVVEPGAATALNEQLQAVNGRTKQRAYFDFNHEEREASGWPTGFYWKTGEAPGVYCRVELSQAGAEAIQGKNFRAFSPVFYVTRTNPAKVICKPDADLCLGSLVNEPAFKEIEPLWAKEGKILQKDEPAEKLRPAEAGTPNEKISAGGAVVVPVAAATNNNNQVRIMGQETPTAAAALTADNSDQLKAKDSKILELETALKARREQDAKDAVAAAVKRGAIPAQNDKLQAKWVKQITENPEALEMLQGMAANPAMESGLTAGAAPRLEAKPGPKLVMQAYEQLTAKAAKVRDHGLLGQSQRNEIARECAALYARDIRNNADVLDMPLYAADSTDTNQGTMAGSLIAQRTLELFKLQFPVLSAISTDFSDMPAQYGQSVISRIVSVPTPATYNTTTGWTSPTAAATDVSITLDEHVGVPITFNSNQLASTMRRLFDEQAPAASYALSKYFVDKIYALLLLANFNGYAAVSGTKIPKAYAKYPVALGDFGRSTLAKLNAVFNPNEVPLNNRFVLLNSDYHAQLAQDPSLVTFYAGQRNPEIVTDSLIPQLAGFKPIEAPNLPTTANMVGFAGHKSGLVIATRTSNDYTQALPGSSYGSVMTITSPDTGISATLVQYVDHKLGMATWRIQVMLGAAVGDKRGGLLMTSQ